MLAKPQKVDELKSLIEKTNHDIYISQTKIRAYIDHGLLHARTLVEYFSPIFGSNTNQLRTILSNLPTSSARAWNDEVWESWDVSDTREEEHIRIGELFEERTNHSFCLPALVPFIGQRKTVIIRSGKNTYALGLSLLQSLVVRTAIMLPHQAQYTLLDPAGNGIAFPMRRYLPQVQDSTGDVRRDLDQVILNIQRIIETYLDASITSFERVPLEIRVNEKYNFIFAADFPNQYDRRAIEALQSIANTGPNAGTYLFIHYNSNNEFPRDMSMEGFKNSCILDLEDTKTYTKLNLKVQYDSVPSADLQARLFQKLKNSKPPERILDWDSLVGLDQLKWWTGRTDRIIETPIGARGGVDKLTLWFGVNSNNQPCAHGMLGAMTGAGKSNLYHVLISGLAIRYSPEELRFYLVDGKDGVEFQPYRHLPHAEVVSLHSSPELSRSVLAELIAEKERRNTTFARVGVNDIVSYREKGEPEGKIPRILLLVDEYQELFEGDKDGIASNYLLQLSQQGRSAGIHMLLASQRFGAAGMLNQTGIFGNIHLLMAMQMKAADVQALTEFGRRGKALIATCDLPGKIVMNDKGGDDAANIAGKVAYIKPQRRDEILQLLNEKSSSLADESLPRRVIFDGKAQPSLLDNPYFLSLLRRTTWPTAQELESFAREPVENGGLGIIDWFSSEHPRALWVGQQFNVRGQAMLILRRRVSENCLIVGGANSARYGMLATIISSLSVSTSPKQTQFVILDRSIAGSQWSNVLRDVYDSLLLPGGFAASYNREAAKVEGFVDELLGELDRRIQLSEEEMMESPSLFVIMTELDGIEAIRRKVDSFGGMTDSGLGEKLRRLCLEGSPLGIHLILSFPGVRSMSNVIDERRGILNFSHRIALQMSEDESHTFARSRKASQLQIEGPVPVCALYVDVQNDLSIRFKPYSSDPTIVEQNESLTKQLCQISEELAKRKESA